MTPGLAMKMKLELSSLARRHRVEPKLSIALPLHPPSPRSVLVTGVACADSIDQERMRFAPRSLTFLPWKLPPLLYRHRDLAGEIERLVWDGGRLLLEGRVDHVEGRRCNGLSIAATIQRYELRDQDDPQHFHALILRADLDGGQHPASLS